MSWSVSTTTNHVARKPYPCDACAVLIMTGLDPRDFTHEDLEKIEAAKSDGWKILPGQTYIKTKGLYDGDWVVFRARPEIDDICLKHDMYED